MMYKKILMAIGTLAFMTGLQTWAQPKWPEVKRETKAGSRWWWMGSAVDKANLTALMEEYAQAGIGTLEITPIYGVKGNAANNIAFLSDKWLDMLKYTIDEGERLGISIDMATGTGWPFGGPMLKTEETASKLVVDEQTATGDGTATVTLQANASNGTLQRVLAYPTKGTEGNWQNLTPLLTNGQLTWTVPSGNWRILAVYCQPRVMQVKRASPGGEGYVLDHFDRQAVAAYLNYFEQRFEATGTPYPHAFFNDSYEITQADWTRNMFEQFEHYRGYQLESVMDKLIDKDKEVTAHYRETLSDMLRDNFTKQWVAWAHKHGAQARNQAHGSPGNLLDLYAEADVPEAETFYQTDFGIKGLRHDNGFTKKGLSSLYTLKYASSAAHVTGKPLVSSESMTWLTEHFRTSLSQMKPELDQLFVSGVNHVMFHGTAYSPKEAPWPGWKFYAASDISPTNSIWRDAPEMMKYIERVQSFMQMGQPDNEILVYAPFNAAMHKTTGAFKDRMLLFDINTLDSKMSQLVACVNALYKAGFDCDYISDLQLLATNTAPTSAPSFSARGGSAAPSPTAPASTVAATNYKALIVPDSTNMPQTVKSHLQQLANQGLLVVYGSDLSSLADTHVTPEPLRQQGLSIIRRRNDTGHHYFISNLTPNNYCGYQSLGVNFHQALLFDPLNGNISYAYINDEGKVYLNLKSGQSIIIQTTVPGAFPPGDPATTPTDTPLTDMSPLSIDGPWQLTFTTDTYPDMQGKTYQLDTTQGWQTLDEATACLMGTGIYQTTFNLTPAYLHAVTAPASTVPGGFPAGSFRLHLGDVRESARVWLNDQYIGCAWSVPYELDCGHALREGTNTLKIEVTNLPANRISQMDRNAIEWRIFEDINIANISSPTYADWTPIPSGLNTNVTLIPRSDSRNVLHIQLETIEETTDGTWQPLYRISLPSQEQIDNVTATLLDGTPFTDFAILPLTAPSFSARGDSAAPSPTASALTVPGGFPAGSLRLRIDSDPRGDIIVNATTTDGNTYSAILTAHGKYLRTIAIDFTADTPPGGGWTVLPNPSEIKGFSDTGKQTWCRSVLNGKEVIGLYDQLTFNSQQPNYYFYFPGFGMYANNDFTLTINAQRDDILQVDYLIGDGKSPYDAQNTITSYTKCDDSQQGFLIDMPGNKSYYIYRSLAVYVPKSSPADISETKENYSKKSGIPFANQKWYDLQGRRIYNRQNGYLKKSGKLILR